MWIETPSEDYKIKTIDDVESKMCPALRLWANNVQPYLIKRFLKIYWSLKDGSQQLDDDTLEELNQIREDFLDHKRLYQEALAWAAARVMARNQSHNVWENLVFPHDQFQDFVSFCDVGEIEAKTLWANKFETLFQKDAEKLKDSALNKKYLELRQQGRTPIEAIKGLPWGKIFKDNMSKAGERLPSNDETLEWSKMWNTDYCLGRVNTILWIVALNEWIDYLNKHFKYADVLRDWLEDILQGIPRYQRDYWYIVECLNMEDPHQILIYIDDDWSQQDIDTNHIWLGQLRWFPLEEIKNVVKTYGWNVSELAYEIYFLNYINTYFNELSDLWEKRKLVKYVELCNKKYGFSYTILKRIINFAQQLRDPQLEDEIFGEIKKLAEEYPCIKDTIAYQMKLNEEDVGKIDEFIRKKYGPQFSFEDVQRILWVE